jgi:phosphoribosylanthranilate isomerase
MGLKHFVKVSQITNLSDARYCAGMMVDLIGFNLNSEHPDYVTPQKFKEITDWVSGVATVGEFGDMSFESILAAIQEYNVDYLQINDVSNLMKFKELGIPLYLKIDANSDLIEKIEKAKKSHSIIKYISIASKTSVAKSKIASIEELLSVFKNEFLFIKGFDNQPDTVSELNEIWHGIMLDGSQEDKPGFKDYGVLMDVLESIED